MPQHNGMSERGNRTLCNTPIPGLMYFITVLGNFDYDLYEFKDFMWFVSQTISLYDMHMVLERIHVSQL